MASTIRRRLFSLHWAIGLALAIWIHPNVAKAQKHPGELNPPTTSQLGVTEVRKRFVCKTHMSFSAGHGTQVSYLRSDGVEVLWYPGNAHLVRGRWRIVENANEPSGGSVDICFQYGMNTYNPVTGRTGGNWECRPASAYFKSIFDQRDGDVFKLANRTVVPFTLSHDKTTIDELQALAKKLDVLSDAHVNANRDNGCDEKDVRSRIHHSE